MLIMMRENVNEDSDTLQMWMAPFQDLAAHQAVTDFGHLDTVAHLASTLGPQ